MNNTLSNSIIEIRNIISSNSSLSLAEWARIFNQSQRQEAFDYEYDNAYGLINYIVFVKKRMDLLPELFKIRQSWGCAMRSDSAGTPLEKLIDEEDPEYLRCFLQALPKELLESVWRGTTSNNARFSGTAIARVLALKKERHLSVLLKVAQEHGLALFKEIFAGSVNLGINRRNTGERESVELWSLMEAYLGDHAMISMLQSMAETADDFFEWYVSCYRNESITRYQKLNKLFYACASSMDIRQFIKGHSSRCLDIPADIWGDLRNRLNELGGEFAQGKKSIHEIACALLNYYELDNSKNNTKDNIFQNLFKIKIILIHDYLLRLRNEKNKQDILKNIHEYFDLSSSGLVPTTISPAESIEALWIFYRELDRNSRVAEKFLIKFLHAYSDIIADMMPDKSGVIMFEMVVHKIIMSGVCSGLFQACSDEIMLWRLSEIIYAFDKPGFFLKYFSEITQAVVVFDRDYKACVSVRSILSHTGLRYELEDGSSLYFPSEFSHLNHSDVLPAQYYRRVSLDWLKYLSFIPSIMTINELICHHEYIHVYGNPPLQLGAKDRNDRDLVTNLRYEHVLRWSEAEVSSVDGKRNALMTWSRPEQQSKWLDKLIFLVSSSQEDRLNRARALINIHVNKPGETLEQCYFRLRKSINCLMWQLSECEQWFHELSLLKNVLNCWEDKNEFLEYHLLIFFIKRYIHYEIKELRLRSVSKIDTAYTYKLISLQKQINLFMPIGGSNHDVIVQFKALIRKWGLELAEESVSAKLLDYLTRLSPRESVFVLTDRFVTAQIEALFINTSRLHLFYQESMLVPLSTLTSNKNELFTLGADMRRREVHKLIEKIKDWTAALNSAIGEKMHQLSELNENYQHAVQLWKELIDPVLTDDNKLLVMNSWYQYVCPDLNGVVNGELNQTLLTKAISLKDVQLCDLLVQCGADPLHTPRFSGEGIPFTPLLLVLKEDTSIYSKESNQMREWLVTHLRKREKSAHLWGSQFDQDKYYHHLKNNTDEFLEFLRKYIETRWRFDPSDLNKRSFWNKCWYNINKNFKYLYYSWMTTDSRRADQVNHFYYLWKCYLDLNVPESDHFYSNLIEYLGQENQRRARGVLISGIKSIAQRFGSLCQSDEGRLLKDPETRKQHHDEFLKKVEKKLINEPWKPGVFHQLECERSNLLEGQRHNVESQGGVVSDLIDGAKERISDTNTRAIVLSSDAEASSSQMHSFAMKLDDTSVQKQTTESQLLEAEARAQENERQKREAEQQKREAEQQKQEAERQNEMLVTLLMQRGIFTTREEVYAHLGAQALGRQS